jgi:hypothetical protein
MPNKLNIDKLSTNKLNMNKLDIDKLDMNELDIDKLDLNEERKVINLEQYNSIKDIL